MEEPLEDESLVVEDAPEVMLPPEGKLIPGAEEEELALALPLPLLLLLLGGGVMEDLL